VFAGGAERPQIGWFWNYVEQCAQAEKAEACLSAAYENNLLGIWFCMFTPALTLRAAAVVVDWNAFAAPQLVRS
jgi:hypothetical protein